MTVFPQKPAIYGRSDTTSGLNRVGFWGYNHFGVGDLLLFFQKDCTQDLIAGHRRSPQVAPGPRRWPYDQSATTYDQAPTKGHQSLQAIGVTCDQHRRPYAIKVRRPGISRTGIAGYIGSPQVNAGHRRYK